MLFEDDNEKIHPSEWRTDPQLVGGLRYMTFIWLLTGFMLTADGRLFTASGAKMETSDAKTDAMKPAVAKAYREYRGILDTLPCEGRRTDAEVYALLQDSRDREGDQDGLLPRETWIRYVRAGRSLHGQQKTTPRYGRRRGASVVTPAEI